MIGNAVIKHYLLVSNNVINCYTPPIDPLDQPDQPLKVIVLFNGKTSKYKGDHQTYVYAGILPTITSIFPDNYSPLLKGLLEIRGSNFGDSESDLKIFLEND